MSPDYFPKDDDGDEISGGRLAEPNVFPWFVHHLLKNSLALPSLHTPFMSRVFDQIAVGDHHMNTTTEHKLHWSNYQHDNIIDKLEGYHYMPINISIASKIMAPHSELAQLWKPSPNNIAHF